MQPKRLSSEELAEIVAHANQRGMLSSEQRLLAHVAWLEGENERLNVTTPDILKALRLLDVAGFGNETPNTLPAMVEKAIASAESTRSQLVGVVKEKRDEWQELFDKDVTGDFDGCVYMARGADEIIAALKSYELKGE